MYGDSKPRVSYKMTMDEMSGIFDAIFGVLAITLIIFIYVTIVSYDPEWGFEWGFIMPVTIKIGVLFACVGSFYILKVLIGYIGRISIEKSLTEVDELETFREVTLESEYGREILKKTKEVIYDKVKTKNVINFCEEKDVKIKRCFQGNECIVEGYYYLENEEGFQKLYNYRVSFIIERCYKFEVNDEVVFENNELYEESKFYNYMYFRSCKRRNYATEKEFENYFIIKLIDDKWEHIHYEVTDDGLTERKLVNEVIFPITPEVFEKWIMWSQKHIENNYEIKGRMSYSTLDEVNVINYYNKSEYVVKGCFYSENDNGFKEQHEYEYIAIEEDGVMFCIDGKIIICSDDYNKRLDKIKKRVLKK